jgi:hypothetical protein
MLIADYISLGQLDHIGISLGQRPQKDDPFVVEWTGRIVETKGGVTKAVEEAPVRLVFQGPAGAVSPFIEKQGVYGVGFSRNHGVTGILFTMTEEAAPLYEYGEDGDRDYEALMDLMNAGSFVEVKVDGKWKRVKPGALESYQEKVGPHEPVLQRHLVDIGSGNGSGEGSNIVPIAAGAVGASALLYLLLV